MDRVEFIALLMYAMYLFGTGAAIVAISGHVRNFVALSFGISISLLVLSQLLLQILGWSLGYWLISVHVWLFVFAMAAFALRRYSRIGSGKSQFDFLTFLGWGSIAIPFSIYHWLFGPYTEIPSDFWSHLGNVKEQLVFIKDRGLGDPNSSWIDSIRNNDPIPIFHALVADSLSVMPIRLVRVATFTSSLLLVTIIYWFTFRISKETGLSSNLRKFAATTASIFFVVSYGVSSFSYIRYYAYFPHIFNLGLFFVIVGIYVDYLNNEKAKNRVLGLLGIFLATSAIINNQEFLFSILLLLSISVWRFTRLVIRQSCHNIKIDTKALVTGLTAMGLAVVGITAGFYLTNSGKWGLPHLIDLGQINELLRGWPIANPNLRFWDTLGLHGLVIYCWYFFSWARFARTDYINTAMFSPVFTLFNPLFVLWFLHVGSWDSIWRLAYLMPLPIVGGILIAITTQEVLKSKVCFRSIVGGLFVAAAVATVFPFKMGRVENTNSRMPSLVKTEESNGAQLWGDLINELNTIEGRRLLITDSVTNYVLSTATKHGGKREPKERWQKRTELFGGDYQDRLLYYGVDDSLLVVNQRDGAVSDTGRVSGHWWEDILLVSKLYPMGLREFLASHPEDFKIIWNKEGIEIYEVLRNPDHY